ncbi:MAG: ABC transporter substrate-binding protein [Acetobacteraceae bacterium]
MKRRTFLAGSAAVAASPLAAPSIARAQGSRVLKFIPQSDVTILDPIWTTAYVTRNHGYLIFDTLYGMDGSFTMQPQMVAGHVAENDGKLWKLTLRDGLLWHDGTPVLARDCVASIERWGKRDSYGQTLIAYTDEMSAPDDKTIQFKLKKPFSMLPEALGKPGSSMCCMMPERLAKTDAFKQVTEMVGSGPFRWKADERVVGSRAVYERNAAYKPRENGPVQWTSGPKIVNFDRVEWHVIPDLSTKAAALQNGEMDWWEDPTGDILPLLRAQDTLKVEVTDPTGLMACLRLNELYPPFDNPAIRRALLKAVNQSDVMIAVAGDPKMIHVPTGIFTPGTPMASDVGLDVFRGPRDYAAVKREIEAAGYKGEKVVFMAPTDFPILKAEADVCADMLKKAGFDVDYQAMDWGTVVQRRAKQDKPDAGGWSAFSTFWAGLDQSNPVGHAFLRGNGKQALFGWPTAPKLEELRQDWIDAPDLPSRKKLAEALQVQALQDVPYVPLGQYFAATAHKKEITGILNGFVMFWNVRRG